MPLCDLSSQQKIDFLFSRGLKGLPRDARFGTNSIFWFVDPNIDPNSLKFFLNGISSIALLLSVKGAIPDLDIFKPSYSISF